LDASDGLWANLFTASLNFIRRVKKMDGLHEDVYDEAKPIELFEEFEPRIEDRQQQEDEFPW